MINLKKTFMSIISLKNIILIITVLSGVVVWAQEPETVVEKSSLGLEEVLVVGAKRTESLQDVPISVQSLSGDDLKEADLNNLADIQKRVPNLNFTSTALTTYIYIRGIGTGDNEGFEQSVGLFIDDIYGGRSRQFRTAFLDLATVEVMLGSQGALLGKNTIAGAINVKSAQPTQDFEGYVDFLYEPKLNARRGTLVLSGPITENLGARLAVMKPREDGYVENTVNGQLMGAQ